MTPEADGRNRDRDRQRRNTPRHRFATRPFLRDDNGARAHFAPGRPFELQFDVARRLPAIHWALRETSLDDMIERGRHLPAAAVTADRRDGWRVACENRRDQTRMALALEGFPAGRHLVQHDAKREDVRARVDRLALELFGRHVTAACRQSFLRSSACPPRTRPSSARRPVRGAVPSRARSRAVSRRRRRRP